MVIRVIKTAAMVPPKDDVYKLLEESITDVGEKSVIAITSKVVAIHQGRCIPLEAGVERDELVPKEADLFVRRDIVPGEYIFFSIKNNVMIASAGMDKSNAKSHLVLWPKEPMMMAKEIHSFIRKKYNVVQLGVIITDSHVIMMRRGTQGVGIGWWGFNPVRDYRGKEDIFGREMMVQTTNVVDSLAAAAVLEMGEGKEQTPLAMITDIGEIEFSEDERVIEGKPSLVIPMEEDLFRPMIEGVKWEKGQGGLTDEELERLKSKTYGKAD